MVKTIPLHEKYRPLRSPLVVALDVDSDTQALHLAEQLQDVAGGFKLGPRLVYRYGKDLCMRLSQLAPLFVDCKFFDIPSTMEAAVQASFESGASLVTIHALAGPEALQKMAELEAKLNQQREFRILCVTILTSWGEDSLPANLKRQPVQEHVRELALNVRQAGLRGLVCSAHELPLFAGQGLYLVTPGIRPLGSDKGDQQRTQTPFQALQAGASALVVGRPIVQAADPRAAAMEIALEMIAEPIPQVQP